VKRYLIRWKINEHCSVADIFEGETKKDATEAAKKTFTKMMPLRKELWKPERIEISELIEKENGDNGYTEEDEDD
jgi:hypothetical protein